MCTWILCSREEVEFIQDYQEEPYKYQVWGTGSVRLFDHPARDDRRRGPLGDVNNNRWGFTSVYISNARRRPDKGRDKLPVCKQHQLGL